MLKFIILGFIDYGTDTGYDIFQQINHSTGYFWHAKQSQIYTTLKKLEKDGLVSSEIQVREGRPDLRRYTMTPAGRAEFEAWLKSPITELEMYKSPLLVKIFFSARLDKEAILTQLRLAKQQHLEQHRLFSRDVKEMIREVGEKEPGCKADVLFWDATRLFGEMCQETWLRWLDEMILMIEKKL